MKNRTVESKIIVEAENLHAGYGKREVLKGISLQVREGEILALIGPNGAGKSTLLKVIAGTLKQTKGKIRWSGEEITDFSPRERVRQGILLFLQGGQVFPSLTVRENLEIGGIALNHKKQNEAIFEVLKVFPTLSKGLSKRAGFLSGGERQMLSLGMVLVNQPKLLLLDEPSAGLAPKLVKEILERIKEINRVFSTTVLLVEQNVRQVLEIAERAFVLVDGKMAAEYQKPEELLNSSELERIFFESIS